MGVDYAAVSGYGFVLGLKEKEMFLNSEDGDFEEDLYKFVSKWPLLQYGMAGQWYYTGDDDDLSIAIFVKATSNDHDAMHTNHNFKPVYIEKITEDAKAQLREAADSLAIDDPRFGFMSGVLVY